LVLNVLWFILDVANVEKQDLIKKLIFVQIVAIELQGLVGHLNEIILVKLTKSSKIMNFVTWHFGTSI